MMALDQVFDRTGRIPRPSYRRLAGEAWSFVSYRPEPPDPAALPDGGGHPVLVVPAYFTTDAFTLPLRRFLDCCGYRSCGWQLGVNWGPTERIRSGLRRRIHELSRRNGGPVSVIGISLGGMLARDLAYDCSTEIRQVITLVSPIYLPTASALEPLVRLCAPFYSAKADLARLASPLPVPSTAIFTRDDGLVAWQSCRIDEPGAIAVEVAGQHVAICRNTEALRAVVKRLAASSPHHARIDNEPARCAMPTASDESGRDPA